MSAIKHKIVVGRLFSKQRAFLVSILLGIVSLLGAMPTFAGPVQLQQFHSFLYAYDNANTGPYDGDSASISGIPSSTNATAALTSSSIAVQLNANGSDSGALFSFATQQSYSSHFGLTRSYGELFFTLTDATTYSLAGNFNTNTGSLAGEVPHPASPSLKTEVFFYVALSNLYNAPIAAEGSRSYSTHNESFALGDLNDGDDQNYTYGPLSGQLGPGNYRLYFENRLQDYTNVDVSAAGGFTLTLGNPAAVPEPSSWLLMLFGLLGLGWRSVPRAIPRMLT